MSTAERTLLLLRHAKSDYPDGVGDHARPLAPRGVREAALAGDWLRANAPRVDAVLCSSATRTRQTLERTGIEAPTEYLDRLYDSTPGITLDVINGVDELFGTDIATLLRSKCPLLAWPCAAVSEAPVPAEVARRSLPSLIRELR